MTPTRYRGAMVAPRPKPEDIKALLSHGANLIRYQLTFPDAGEFSDQEYYVWAMVDLGYLNKNILPIIGDAKIVLDLHTLPGGLTADNTRARMFTDRKWAQGCLLDVWATIARNYKDDPRVWAYGIGNEFPGRAKEVWDIQHKVARLIRTIDSRKRIAVTTPYSNPTKFATFQPFELNNIWYEAHVYYPAPVAMQGIAGRKTPVHYPTALHTKERLLKHLEPFLAFKKKINRTSRLFVGEFSCSGFAPEETRVNLLRDIIQTLERSGVAWCYHAWREASVWDAESAPAVIGLLDRYWRKNR